MRTTIRQVAERAKVSPMTVSNVLLGRKPVSPEIYERVIKSVHELNYIPVRPVLQNRRMETRAIGLVPFHADISHYVIDSLTNGGICEGARKHGYDVLVMLRDASDWMANRQDIRFLERRSDGFIFVSSGIGEWKDALDLLVENQIPTVVCYRRDVPEGVVWVDPDNEAIIHNLLGCLRHHGHRRVAYLGAPEIQPEASEFDPDLLISSMGRHEGYDDVQRRTAFQTAMQEDAYWEQSLVLVGTTPDWEIIPDILPQLQSEGITGVICVNDHLALKFLDLAQASGVRVPEDISVAGVDDLPEVKPRGLTSIGFGYREVGRLAIEAWMELHSGMAPQDCHKVVPVHLVERTSVGRVPE